MFKIFRAWKISHQDIHGLSIRVFERVALAKWMGKHARDKRLLTGRETGDRGLCEESCSFNAFKQSFYDPIRIIISCQ